MTAWEHSARISGDVIRALVLKLKGEPHDEALVKLAMDWRPKKKPKKVGVPESHIDEE